MYELGADPYCYPGTSVLRNLKDLRTATQLRAYERALTAQRAEESMPTGRLSISHYYAIHHHIFQDIYSWAGKPRTVRITKGTSTFCYPENIAREMTQLFAKLRKARFFSDLQRDEFSVNAAHFLAELNAIHPFRDGNGRVQLIFLTLIAANAGYPFKLVRLKRRSFVQAVILSFSGEERSLKAKIRRLID